MNFLNTFASLFSNFGNLTWQMVVMWGIGALLIYLAIAKKMEPSLLLPMGFGAILVNLPLSGAITQGETVGPINALFDAGMSNELFPLPLFFRCAQADDRRLHDGHKRHVAVRRDHDGTQVFAAQCVRLSLIHI